MASEEEKERQRTERLKGIVREAVREELDEREARAKAAREKEEKERRSKSEEEDDLAFGF